MGNEMRADQTVGGAATNKKTADQQPNSGMGYYFPRSNRRRSRAHAAQRSHYAGTGDSRLPSAVRFQSNLGRIVAHENINQRQQNQRDDNKGHRTHAPAGVSNHRHEERQENNLSRRTGAAQNTQSEPAPRYEPAV